MLLDKSNGNELLISPDKIGTSISLTSHNASKVTSCNVLCVQIGIYG